MIRTSTSVFNRFFDLLTPDRSEIRNIYVFAIFSGILSLGMPLGIQMIINFIQLGQISTSWFILVALVVSAIGFSGILNIFQLRITENLQQRIFTRAAFEFAERIPKIKMVELVKRYAPELTNRFFDTLTIQKGLSKLLIDFTAASLQILFGLILLSFYHSFFLFTGLFLVVLLILIIRVTVKKGYVSSMDESTFKYKIAHWLEEIAHARISFKMSGRSKMYLNRTNDYLNNYLTAREKHFKVLVQQYGFLIAFKVAIALTLLTVGGLLVINEQINIGQFVAAEIVILLVLTSVEKLVLSIEVVYDVLTAVEKIGQVMDLELEDYNGAQLVRAEKGIQLKVDGLMFRTDAYLGTILDGIELRVKPNEKIGIISDTSLSTNALFCILSGLYEKTGGNLEMDGIPIENLNKSELRNQIGSLLKQDQLVYASLYDNIAMGDKSADLNRVVEIFAELGLSDFVAACPENYKTIINPEAHFIPKDIHTKLLIARAAIGQPRLVLLEDPTSGMSLQQVELLQGYLAIFQNATILIETHHVGILEKMDRVIEFKEGKIVYDGNYKGLNQTV
jgi:ABC-type bacteriocin/lantibiotic exporter with double-glycine peptidase domain